MFQSWWASATTFMYDFKRENWDEVEYPWEKKAPPKKQLKNAETPNGSVQSETANDDPDKIHENDAEGSGTDDNEHVEQKHDPLDPDKVKCPKSILIDRDLPCDLHNIQEIISRPTKWGKSNTLVRLWTNGKFQVNRMTLERLGDPRDVCFLPTGNLAIADPESKRVKVVSQDDGQHVHNIDGNITQELIPYCVTTTGAGYIMVADIETKRLKIYSNKRPFMRQCEWGFPFEKPVAVCRNNDDQYIVIDSSARTVNLFDTKGIRIRSFGQQHLTDPSYVSFDNLGRIYVVDQSSIVVFDHEGNYFHTFGGRGTAAHQLNNPKGIAVDLHCNIYVCDYDNDRIAVFSPDGRLKRHLVADGLKGPVGLALDIERGLLAITNRHMSWNQISLYKLC